jgi:hypothetical protein
MKSKPTNKTFRAVIGAGAGLALAVVGGAALAVGGGDVAQADSSGEKQPIPNAVVTAQVETTITVADEPPAQFDAAEIRGPVTVMDTDTNEITEFDSYDSLIQAFDEEGDALIAGDNRLTSADAATASRATYVLATFYSDANDGGSTLMATTSISTFCASNSYTGHLTGSWIDAVSSFKTYGDCRSRLYENTYQGGSNYGPAVQASSIGVMNDEASSYRIVD